MLIVTTPVVRMLAVSLPPGTTTPQLAQSPDVAQLPVVVFQVQFAAIAGAAKTPENKSATASAHALSTQRLRACWFRLGEFASLRRTTLGEALFSSAGRLGMLCSPDGTLA